MSFSGSFGTKYTKRAWFAIPRGGIKVISCVCAGTCGTRYSNTKLRADCSQGLLAIVRCRIFCLPVCYPKTKIYRSIMLTVVLYGCEAWLLTLREELRLRMLENMVLRISESKRVK